MSHLDRHQPSRSDWHSGCAPPAPAKPAIKPAADWMRAALTDTPNDWIQISKTSDGNYAAAMAKETFDVPIRVSLVNGKIVSAAIDNPVGVLERDYAVTAWAIQSLIRVDGTSNTVKGLLWT